MGDMYLDITPGTLAICADCDHLTAQEDFCHADRVLDFYVCDYVTHGAISVTEDETDYEITAGNMLILEKGHRHYGKYPISKGTQWYYIHFYISESSCPVSGTSFTLPKLLVPENGTEDELQGLVRCFQSQGASADANIRLMKILCSLSLQKEKSLSDRISEHLENICLERFSSAELERHFYLSYKYMASVFRREKGMTMQEYHDSIKLRRCASMLRSTLMSISEISAVAGYSDPLYFSRRFHNYSGMSPSEYRKNIKERM
ncbi:MAG: helix-turn-helix transcriptional regulator [Oscillospiraceae bacterium]|nr:helix-turn-helix transcriptional regulator [Oscillospiraceae bacterium]